MATTADFKNGLYLKFNEKPCMIVWFQHVKPGKGNTFMRTKLKNVVPGFTPTVRFEDGIRMTIDYIMSHPEYQKEDEEFDIWCDKIIDTLEQVKKDWNS